MSGSDAATSFVHRLQTETGERLDRTLSFLSSTIEFGKSVPLAQFHELVPLLVDIYVKDIRQTNALETLQRIFECRPELFRDAEREALSRAMLRALDVSLQALVFIRIAEDNADLSDDRLYYRSLETGETNVDDPLNGVFESVCTFLHDHPFFLDNPEFFRVVLIRVLERLRWISDHYDDFGAYFAGHVQSACLPLLGSEARIRSEWDTFVGADGSATLARVLLVAMERRREEERTESDLADEHESESTLSSVSDNVVNLDSHEPSLVATFLQFWQTLNQTNSNLPSISNDNPPSEQDESSSNASTSASTSSDSESDSESDWVSPEIGEVVASVVAQIWSTGSSERERHDMRESVLPALVKAFFCYAKRARAVERECPNCLRNLMEAMRMFAHNEDDSLTNLGVLVDEIARVPDGECLLLNVMNARRVSDATVRRAMLVCSNLVLVPEGRAILLRLPDDRFFVHLLGCLRKTEFCWWGIEICTRMVSRCDGDDRTIVLSHIRSSGLADALDALADADGETLDALRRWREL